MDAPGRVPETINCHACGAVIDLTGQTWFTHVDCSHCGALSVVPLQFGNFLLLNPLGIGGVGTVYKAIDLSLNRYLALKILRKKLAANPEYVETFSREARSAAAVNHPNVAQIYSFGEQDGQYYLAMELLGRGSLDDRILKLGKLSEAEVLDIGAQIASGLRAAYQRGLLHRDVKPGNILFNSEGVPKIVDFGLAQIHMPAATQPIPKIQQAQSQQIWGTPYYIAPEKLRGQPEDFRADMYSLGASLFHALAGQPPFEAPTAGEIITKHATQPAHSLKTYVPNTHDYTARVMARMLAKNPAERYDSYDELIHDLQEAQAVLKAAEQARAVVAPAGKQFTIASIVGTIATVIVCSAIVLFVWKNRVGMFRRESAPQQTAGAPKPAGPASVLTGPTPGNAIEHQRAQQDQTRQEAERQSQERAAHEQEQFAGEKKLLQAIELEVVPLWQNYDFKAALAKYGTLGGKLETAEGRRLLEQRVAASQLLVEFKTQLAADFARWPYDRGDLQTRNLTQLSGQLVRATDTQVVFATPNGELVTDWRDLTPATLVKLADFYVTALKPTEKAELLARRYFALAVFCRQYGLEQAAANYVRQATELMPSLQEEAAKIFGKVTS